jgi:hypothetical protein
MDLSDELIERYNKFEIVLRCALSRASTDVDFSKLFSTDGAIEGKFGCLP